MHKCMLSATATPVHELLVTVVLARLVKRVSGLQAPALAASSPRSLFDIMTAVAAPV